MKYALFLLIIIYSLPTISNDVECTKYKESFKKIHELIGSAPCAEGSSEECKSLEDQEQELKALLAKHRLLTGIKDLHEDLNKSKMDPELLLVKKKLERFLNITKLKLALENTFNPEDPTVNYLSEASSDLDALCEKPSSELKNFCFYFKEITDPKMRIKIENFSEDIKISTEVTNVSPGVETELKTKKEMIKEKKEILNEIYSALREVKISPDKDFATLYGPNLRMNPAYFDNLTTGLKPENFDNVFKIENVKDTIKGYMAEIKDIKLGSDLTDDQKEIFAKIKKDLIFLGNYDDDDFKSIQECLLKANQDCLKDFDIDNGKELEKEIEAKQAELKITRDSLAPDPKYSKYIIAQAYLLKSLKETCAKDYQEEIYAANSCYNPEIEIFNKLLYTLGEDIQGIIAFIPTDSEQKELTRAELKNNMCNIKDFEEVASLCPKEAPVPEISDYEKMNRELKEEEKSFQTQQIARDAGKLLQNLIYPRQNYANQSPYYGPNWYNPNPVNYSTPSGFNPFLDTNGRYNPSGMNYYYSPYGPSRYDSIYNSSYAPSIPKWGDPGFN